MLRHTIASCISFNLTMQSQKCTIGNLHVRNIVRRSYDFFIAHVHVLCNISIIFFIQNKLSLYADFRARILTASRSGVFFVRGLYISNAFLIVFHRLDCYLLIISTIMIFYSLELIKIHFVAVFISFIYNDLDRRL